MKGAVIEGQFSLTWPEIKYIIFAIVVLSMHCTKFYFVTSALIDYDAFFVTIQLSTIYFSLSECFILCREACYACLLLCSFFCLRRNLAQMDFHPIKDRAVFPSINIAFC